MGNSFSSGTSAFVQCEKQTYFAGEGVQGIVCLNCAKDLQTTGIELKVVGYEKARFTEMESHTVSTSEGSRTEMRTVTRDSDQTFFKVSVTLAPAGHLSQGQYQYAFAFVLPPDLPSSFSYHKGDVKAQVLYKVKAEVHTSGMLKSKIKGKQVLVVNQRSYAVPHGIVKQAETQINLCCCIPRGHASAQIDVDKDRYAPGETAQIMLEAENQSSENFDAVEVQLMQLIGLKADGHKKTIKNYFKLHSYPGIPPYTTLQGGLARHIPLALPSDVPATTHGALITCDYQVKVKLNTKGAWGPCISDLKMHVPVVIHPSQPVQEFFYERPPPGWAPQQVYPPVALEVPSAPPLPPGALDPNCGFWLRAMPPPPPSIPGGQEAPPVPVGPMH